MRFAYCTLHSKFTVMHQRRNHPPHLRHPRHINLRIDNPRPFPTVGYHFAPQIHHQRRPKRLPVARMLAAHRRCYDVAAVFNCACLQQLAGRIKRSAVRLMQTSGAMRFVYCTLHPKKICVHLWQKWLLCLFIPLGRRKTEGSSR